MSEISIAVPSYNGAHYVSHTIRHCAAVLANPLPEILVTVTDPQVAAGGAAWCERFDPRPLPAVRKLTADAGKAPFFDRVWLPFRLAASRHSLGNVAALGLGSAVGRD